jgi:hypothetical protein
MTHAGMPSGRSGATMFVVFALLGSVALLVLLCRTEPFSTDYPWLLRMGQWILDHGALPLHDPFSWTTADRPIVPHQWLFEVLVASIDRFAGPAGLCVFYGAVAMAVYIVWPLASAVPAPVPSFPILAFSVAGLVLLPVNLSIRPMLAGAALLMAQYVLIERLRSGRVGTKAAIAMLATIYVLWANLHTSFVFGFGSLFMFALGDWLERRGLYRFRPADPSIEGHPLSIIVYVLLLGAAFLGSLVNPVGIGLHLYIANAAREPLFRVGFQEMAPPDFSNAYFLMWLALIAATAWIFRRPWLVVSAAGLLNVVFFAWATASVGRIVVWSIVVLVLVSPRAIYQAQYRAAKPRDPQPDRRHLAAVLAIAGVVLPLAAWPLGTTAWREGACLAFRPAAIQVNAAIDRGAGRLFNDPTSGSCLFLLDPPPRVFIDTRFDLYGAALTREAIALMQADPGWQDALARRQVGLVMVETKWPLAKAIAGDPDFLVLYRDVTAVVARRR